MNMELRNGNEVWSENDMSGPDKTPGWFRIGRIENGQYWPNRIVGGITSEELRVLAGLVDRVPVEPADEYEEES